MHIRGFARPNTSDQPRVPNLSRPARLWVKEYRCYLFKYFLTNHMEIFDSLLHYSLRKIQKFHLVYWCGKFAETYSFWRVSGESPKTMRKLCLPQNFHTTKLGENTVFHVVNQTQNQISRYFDKKWRCDQVIFLQLRISLSGIIFLLYILTFF